MSDVLMELNDIEFSYIDFETDSDDASIKSDEDLVVYKSLFYFKKFSVVWTSEGFSIRDILYWKTHYASPNVELSFSWLKHFF